MALDAATEQDLIANAGVTTAHAKYAAALLLSHLRSIKDANPALNASLIEVGHNWMGADAAGSGATAINVDIAVAINPDSLALLRSFATARVAGPGVSEREVGMNLA